MPGISSSSLRAFGGRYLIALFVALVLTATGVAAVNREIDTRVAAIKRVPVVVAAEPPGGANYLMIGSDTRALGDASDPGFGDDTGVNSDTLMVAHIEPGAKRAVVVSFPRDLKVEVPNSGGRTAKINSFYGSGTTPTESAQAVVDMLWWNFQIPINHYVEVDFQTFRQVVSAIGSVNTYFPYPARDDKTGLYVPNPGCVAINGAQALEYVRSRYLEYQIDGQWQLVGQDAPDIHRIERQQQFIRTLLGVAISKSLGNPFVALDIADNALQYMKLDNGVGRDQVDALIKAFRTVDVNDPNSVRFETIPAVDDGSRSTLKLADGAEDMINTLRTFGDAAPPPVTVVPSQVKVKVIEAFKLDRAQGVQEELKAQGFVTKGASNAAKETLLSEIRYPPSQLAAAKLLLTYVPDAGLFPDPALTDHLVLVLGAGFTSLTVPTTTAPVPVTSTPDATAAPVATPAPTTTTTAQENACA